MDINVAGDILFERPKINIAGLHHCRSIHVVYTGEQQMLQCHGVVLSLTGVLEGCVQPKFTSSAEPGPGPETLPIFAQKNTLTE